MAARGQGTVLLVEDSAPMRELLGTVLRRAGYELLPASDGEEGLQLFSARRPDIVLLDVHLPGLNGWEVLERLRERSEIPILMLTALADDTSKVRALNAGADDYLVKPASAPELIARVGALLRRARRVPGLDGVTPYDDGVVRVDFDARVVEVGGRELSLTPLEYRLLSTFVRHPATILSREDLLREVWHDETGGPSDHVKIYVGYLRKKLGKVAEEEMIETVRGFGYRWMRRPVEAAEAADPAVASSSWRTN
jgi:DNA-binding response OmpR family regulator